jgi:chromate transporter
MLVEELKWVSEAEFAEYYALGQILPGANVFNMGLVLGHRYCGWRGSVGAGLGFFSIPMFTICAAAVFYQHFGAHPLVNKALTGMFVVVVGLTIANALKMAKGMPRRARAIFFGLLTFLAIGALRLPLLWIMVAMGPLGILLAWREGAPVSSVTAETSTASADRSSSGEPRA